MAPKPRVTVHLEADVLAWFRSTGAGWNTRINDVLREWYEAHAMKNDTPGFLNGVPLNPKWHTPGWIKRGRMVD